MNFFDAQDNARRTTRRLIVVYVLATAIIVAGISLIVAFALWNLTGVSTGNVDLFLDQQKGIIAAAAVVTTLVIIGATLYKAALLSTGGGRVARDLGGTLVPPDVQDPLRRRLRNVVEEMAIASGVPVPEIYVLEGESAINAFAAGFSPGDAAIAVTRGTLELLDRDELQGVVAHEFSHILNGDMRLNIRLMGVLFGIMVIGLLGRLILRGSHRVSFSSRNRGKGAPAVFLIGIGMFVLGYIGVFFARLIKSSVSRQREFLADASAVQFTRQTTGIANALKKIGGYQLGSVITSTDPEEVGHMLFGAGQRLRGAFATHPPLADRIRALDPSFKEGDYPAVDPRQRNRVTEASGPLAGADGLTRAFAETGRQYEVEDIVDSIGDPEDEHVLYAAGIRRSIPADLYDAAHSPELALLLAVAMILSPIERDRERQLVICRERLGNERTTIVERLHASLVEVGPEFRLPLLEISFPALKNRPAQHIAFLVELLSRLIDVDGEFDLFEFCYLRILTTNLGQAVSPSRPPRRLANRPPKREIREAAINLLRVVAHHSHSADGAREKAYQAGRDTLPAWAAGYDAAIPGGRPVEQLNHSLDALTYLNDSGRRTLMRAVSAVVMEDQILNIHEAALVRAVCATLDLPLPPILVHDD